MKAMIEDGKGGGDKAEVRANALAVSTGCEALKANLRGDAYVVLSDITSAATTNDYFYLMNNDTRDLVVYEIEGWFDDAKQEISIYIGAMDDGTGNGDTLTPVNMNTGSGNAANVECTQDATELAITGGSVAGLLKFSETALLYRKFSFPAGIIVAPGTRFHLECLLNGLCNTNVYFYFRE